MSNGKTPSIRERLTRREFGVVILILAVSLLIFSTAISRAWTLHQRLTCQENLKVIGVALHMYASESEGEYYPRQKRRDCTGNIQPWSGAIDLDGFSPEYLKDIDLLVCPSYPAGGTAIEIWDKGKTTNSRWKAVEGFSGNGVVEPCEVLAKPYYYYGWTLSEATFESVTQYKALEPEDEFSKFLKGGGVPVTVEFYPPVHFERFKLAVNSLASKLESGAEDTIGNTWNMEYLSGKPIELPLGSEIWRLREGVERFYSRDIGNPAASKKEQARIVVLHEELLTAPEDFYHGAGRVNILYMDGHVECREWLSKPHETFPLNEAGLILHEAVEGDLAQGTQR